MAIYALGDLHLSHAVDKPMGIFGMDWEGHAEKIRQQWREVVQDTDLVLIPGDISWAMTLDEALPDLDFIGELPGDKVMIRGNHDYWWNGIGKLRAVLPSQCFAIQNDAQEIGDFVVCGSRGWMSPSHPKFTDEDETIYHREIGRLKMSLQAAAKVHKEILAMLHYPPCGPDGEDSPFTKLLEEFGVTTCVYGHLHGAAHRFAFEGAKNGVQYNLVSADYLRFAPFKLPIPQGQ